MDFNFILNAKTSFQYAKHLYIEEIFLADNCSSFASPLAQIQYDFLCFIS